MGTVITAVFAFMSQSLGDAVEEDYVNETGYLIDLHSLVLKLRNVYICWFVLGQFCSWICEA